jgi:hypothetical protein
MLYFWSHRSPTRSILLASSSLERALPSKQNSAITKNPALVDFHQAGSAFVPKDVFHRTAKRHVFRISAVVVMTEATANEKDGIAKIAPYPSQDRTAELS